MVTIDIWLFGKPEWEIDLDKATPANIKELGEDLKIRLGRISEIMEKLESNDWNRGAGLYNLYFYKGFKKEDAVKELEKLGIGEKEVNFQKDEDEFIDEEIIEFEEEQEQ